MSSNYFGNLILPLYLACVLILVSGNEKDIYSPQERNALDKFREMTKDVLHLEYQKLDGFLHRWLKARNFNITRANDMIRASMKYRKENKIDGIRNETILEFSKPIYAISGVDYEGRPLIKFSPTSVDMRKLIIAGAGHKMTRYWDKILEEGEWRLAKAYKDSDGKVFQGLGIFLQWVLHYERDHPEMAKHLVWINVPRAFIPILELVRPLLAEGSRKALQVFPPDRQMWQTFLLQHISADQLTYQFGGRTNGKSIKP